MSKAAFLLCGLAAFLCAFALPIIPPRTQLSVSGSKVHRLGEHPTTPELITRSSKTTADATQSSLFPHLLPRKVGEGSQTPEEEQVRQRTREVNGFLRELGIRPDEPTTAPILNFWRRDQGLLQDLTNEQKQNLYQQYRSYQQVFPVRGSSHNIRDPEVLRVATTLRSGRDRFTRMIPIIDYMRGSQSGLPLDSVHRAYLETLSQRFAETKDLMHPTIDDIRSRSEAEGVASLSNFYAQGSTRIRSISLEGVVTRFQASVDQAIRERINRIRVHKTRWTADIFFLNNLEKELDAAVEGLSEAGTSTRRLLPRAIDDDANAGPSSPQPSTHRPNTILGVEPETGLAALRDMIRRESIRHTTDSGPLIDFWKLEQKLFQPIQNDIPARQLLVPWYQRHQAEFPVRGSRLNVWDKSVAANNIFLGDARNRLVSMIPVIDHMLEHHEVLRLDPVRKAYLEELRRRFQATAANMEPTLRQQILAAIKESADSTWVYSVLALFTHDEQLSLEELNRRLHEVLNINRPEMHARIKWTADNIPRLQNDLQFVADLEEALDHAVDRLSEAGTSARRLLPRAIGDDENAGPSSPPSTPSPPPSPSSPSSEDGKLTQAEEAERRLAHYRSYLQRPDVQWAHENPPRPLVPLYRF